MEPAAFMGALAYSAYLVALLASPLLVVWRWGHGLPWRWGLALALEVTVAELALVFAFSKVSIFLLALGFGTLPVLAALAGGGLAMAWLTVVSVLRAAGRLP